MADDHIIRVIIQGYDRLSGAIKNAVNDSTPQLDKLNTKLRQNQKEAKDTSSSFSKMSEEMRRDGVEIDNTRNKLNKLGDSVRKLREEAKKSQALGSITSGIQAGRDISANQNAEIEKRLAAARNARTAAQRAIDLERRRSSLEADQRAKAELARLRDQAAAERVLADQHIARLREEYKVRKEQLTKEIELARQMKTEGGISPDRVNELKREIDDRKKAIDDEKAVNAERKRQIKSSRDAVISELDQRRRSLIDARKQANDDKNNRTISPADRQEAAANARTFDAARGRRIADIAAAKSAAAEAIAGAKEESRIRTQSHEEAIRQAQQELKFSKSTPGDASAAAELIRERQAVIREEGQNLDKEISVINQRHRENVISRNESVKDDLRKTNLSLGEKASLDRSNLIIPNVDRGSVIRDVSRDSEKAIKDLGGLERASAKVVVGLEDLKKGFAGGRKGLADFTGDALKNQSVMTQVGAAFGEATKGINKVVNVKWNLIIGAIQTVGTLAVEVGSNLISLASSAVFAAGAIGGAFVAALAQAIPVVGLLAATFQELQNAIKVVQLRQKANDAASVDATAQAKAHKSAVQQLADAHYGLKQAQQGVIDSNLALRDSHERVTDAMREQKDANEALVKARETAARAIVDAAFAERDAELSLRDANLGVLDAKQKLKDFDDKARADQTSLKDAQAAVKEAQARLAVAKAEGDQAEVTAALQNLSIANQSASSVQDQISSNANDRKQLVLGVDQANLTQQKAVVTRRRAINDNRVRQQQGVAGSPEVKAALDAQRNANRQLRDAIQGVTSAEQRRADAEHQVAVQTRAIANAQDAVTAASDKMSAAQRNAQREFNKLSDPEKNFVLAAERLVAAWKKLVRPITDIITNSITRLIDSVIKLLQDPRIQSALTKLATQIGKGISAFGKFISDPETKKQLTGFITEAAKNMPTIVDAFLHILHIVMDIATAAAPIFSSLLGGANSLLGRAQGFTDRPQPRTAPRDPRLARLEPVGQTTPGKTTHGESPLERFLGVANKNLNSWLKLIGAITRFFRYLFGGAQSSGNTLVGQLTDAFNHWANWLRDNAPKVRKFFDEARNALIRIARILGPLVAKLVEAFSSKGAQAYTEFILTVVIPALVLLLSIIQEVTGWFVSLTKVPVVGSVVKWIAIFAIAAGLLVKLFPILKVLRFFREFILLWKSLGFISAFVELFPLLASGIEAIGAALEFVFIANPWIAIIIGIIALIVLLDRKFHFLGPTLRFLGNLFKKLGENIIEFFTHPIRWLQEHWKGLLLAAVMGPFALLAAAISHFFPGFATKIENGFKKAFSGVKKAIKTVLEDVPNAILKLFDGLGAKVAEKIFGFLPPKARKIAKSAFNVAANAVTGGLFGLATGHAAGGEIGGARGTDTVPAWLTPGEWVLNKAQQLKLAHRLGSTVEATKMVLFGSGGASPATGTVSGNSVSENGLWQGYHNFDVHATTDDQGNVVNFIRFKDGTWGQITNRAAARIAQTKGSWVPGYARRAAPAHGGLFETARRSAVRVRGLRSDAFDRRFAAGGIVSAMGANAVGPVLRGPAGGGGNTVHQEFNVKTQGDTDWNHVMRVGAIYAQESY